MAKDQVGEGLRANVVAVIVAYHPDLVSLQKNIRAVSPQVSKVYVWDNTGIDSPLAQVDFPRSVEYIQSDQNLGIAEPLNRVAELASECGAAWMLTLDQDSTLPADYVSKVLGKAQHVGDSAKIGIAAGAHDLSDSTCLGNAMQVKTLITSGSLVCLQAYKAVGGCDEDFFIDCVDHEIALKMRSHGWHLWCFEDVSFSHRIGDPQEVVMPIVGVKLCCSNHSALRKYYATRNRIKLYVRYFIFDPLFCLRDIYAMFAESAKIMLFEKAKASKMRAIVLGFVDAVNGIGGSCRHRF